MRKPSRSLGVVRACVVGCVAILGLVRWADAFYLDTNRDFSIRMRAYDEVALAAEVSQPQTKPKRSPFQLIEDRHGIVRTEMEFFLNEPAFIPSVNIPFQNELRAPPLRKVLAGLGQHVKGGPQGGTIPYANFVRFELGYDRFFFYRPLNPTSSFTWVTAYVGQWNVTESLTGQDFRFNGQQKPTSTGVRTGANTQGLSLATISRLHTVDKDFVDLYPYESFFQSHLETTYKHGRLTPGITMIVGLDGTYAMPVQLLEWEKGSDIAFVGGGIAMVIAAVAFLLRDATPRARAGEENAPNTDTTPPVE